MIYEPISGLLFGTMLSLTDPIGIAEIQNKIPAEAKHWDKGKRSFSVFPAPNNFHPFTGTRDKCIYFNVTFYSGH